MLSQSGSFSGRTGFGSWSWGAEGGMNGKFCLDRAFRISSRTQGLCEGVRAPIRPNKPTVSVDAVK